MTKPLETEIRRAVMEVIDATPPAPPLSSLDRPSNRQRGRSRLLLVACSLLVIGAVVVVALARHHTPDPLIPNGDGDRTSTPTEPAPDHTTATQPHATAPTSAPTTAPMTPTIAPTIAPTQNTVVASPPSAAGILSLLPAGWRVTAQRSMPVGEPGLRNTRQYWGDLASDGISFTRLLELVVVATPGQPDQPVAWTTGGITADNVTWRTNGAHFEIDWANFTRPDIEQFIAEMKPRDPANPLAGFDANRPPLQTEQISSATAMQPESWIDIDLANDNGQTITLTIYSRSGIASSLGLSLDRIRIGTRVALVSPAAFTAITGGRTLDWAGDGIQYRVSTPNSDLATITAIATTVNDIGDQTWPNLLSANNDNTQPTTLPAPSATTVGPVNFTLPANAGDYRPSGTPPDFVVAHHVWSISDQGILTVAVQSEVPLFPPAELIEEFDANGLHWRVYDTGPTDGSITTAYAQIGATSAVLVGGQAWGQPGANQLVRTYVVDVARSLNYQPT